jgi:hypothetical protein
MKEIEASLWVHARKNPSNVEKLISKLLAKKKIKSFEKYWEAIPYKIRKLFLYQRLSFNGAHIFERKAS